MGIEQLRYLVTVASFSSINQAAASLHLSQPNLSLALRALEEELGFDLFNRTHRGVELTARGSAFLEQAKQVLLQFDHLRENAGTELCGKPSLSIAGMPLCKIRKIVKDYLALHPEDLGSLAVEIDSQDSVIDRVSGQECDVGIIYTYEMSLRSAVGRCNAKNVHCSTLSSFRAAVVIGRGNPFYEQQEDMIPIRKLASFYRLSFGKKGRPSSLMTFIPELERPRGEIVVNDHLEFLQVLHSSPSFGIVPHSVNMPYLAEDASGLRVMRLDAEIGGEFLFLKHAAAQLTVAGEEFLRLAEQFYAP